MSNKRQSHMEEDKLRLAQEIADATQVNAARAEYLLKLVSSHRSSLEWEQYEDDLFYRVNIYLKGENFEEMTLSKRGQEIQRVIAELDKVSDDSRIVLDRIGLYLEALGTLLRGKRTPTQAIQQLTKILDSAKAKYLKLSKEHEELEGSISKLIPSPKNS